jgi:hypothetical protein
VIDRDASASTRLRARAAARRDVRWVPGLLLVLAGAAQAEDASPLRDALLAEFDREPGPIRYFAAQADLNGDGRPERIVYVAGPMVCGTGGCSTLVFTEEAGRLRLVSTINLTRPPIVAAETSTAGWRDLVVRVSGGGILPGSGALLRFDGQTYPFNSSVAPALRLEADIPGTVLIARFESFTEGERLVPGPDEDN